MEAPVTAEARKMGTVKGGGAPGLLPTQPYPAARLMRLSTIAAPSAAACTTACQSKRMSRPTITHREINIASLSPACNSESIVYIAVDVRDDSAIMLE